MTLRHKGGVDYRINQAGFPRGPRTNPVTHNLRELGLCGTHSGTKFVPDVYLHNSARFG